MAPHTPNLAFSFLACACALLGVAPHTSNLAFSFLACACSLLGGLRTRQILLFLFWRVLVPCWGGSAHAKSCFFFSGVCMCPVGGGGSAHAKSCFFFSGMCLCPVGGCSAHAKSCLFFSGMCLCPVGGCSAHAKSCLFLFGVCLLSSTSSASRHGNAPSLRSAAGRRLALELLTSSASQPPHSYLKASIGSMRAALFAG